MNQYKSIFYLERYFPKGKGINNLSELCYKHKKTNISIDIFKVINTPNGNIHYSYGSICSKKKNKRCEFINNFKLENIMFLGKKYLSPNKDFLVSHYGDDWNVIKKFSYDEGLSNNGYKSCLLYTSDAADE